MQSSEQRCSLKEKWVKSLKENSSKSSLRSHGAHFLRGRNFCSLIRSKSRKENTQKINQNQESKTHTKYRIILVNLKFLLRLRSTLHPPHPPAGRGVRASHPTKFQPFLKLSTSGLLYGLKIWKKIPKGRSESTAEGVYVCFTQAFQKLILFKIFWKIAKITKFEISANSFPLVFCIKGTYDIEPSTVGKPFQKAFQRYQAR